MREPIKMPKHADLFYRSYEWHLFEHLHSQYLGYLTFYFVLE